MSKVVRFTKAEMERAAKIAKEHNVTVKIDREGSLLVIPDVHRVSPVDLTDEEDLDRELAAFEARHGFG